MEKCDICNIEFKNKAGLIQHNIWKHLGGIKSAREAKIGKNNPMWKGNKVGLGSLHEWIKNRLKRPDKCELCGNEFPIDLANISQEYKRDLSDWEWLCRRCHMLKDNRMKNLIQNSGNPIPRGKEHYAWREELTRFCDECGKVLNRQKMKTKKCKSCSAKNNIKKAREARMNKIHGLR